ncbi:glyceraldehyde-3-phosphate dehydrogenase [Mycoplasma ovis str. Michigan]|uniref:Glyceraldehyde-3-phosphate dehydrogenase n=1 Tax=Mycoplasma ovis str. Michigan TaxID=1415773 RepID=A0ABM5P087_9MOLU|nr:aldehyde dehydrogenase family protein [Mycoplasma ovis]AHC39790.1 glyceraldehyde-3-phosphate dehydrogenase [Mycoplasma ovis str. Michigan]
MYKANSYIHGEVVTAKLPEEKLYSPLTGECIGTIPILDEKHKRWIFESAQQGFEKWKQVDYKTREKFMFLFGSKLKEHSRLLVQLIRLETGKTEKDAQEEVDRSIDYITETVHAFDKLIQNPKSFNSEKYPLMSDDLEGIFYRVPLGVALIVTPYNYPVNTVIIKMAPAILMGNSVVLKSSLSGSLSGWLISKIFNELSIDDHLITPGVLNFYTGRGSELSKYLTESKPNISALSFTGGREAGIELSRSLPAVPQSLELSALNVAIVLEDYGIDSIKEIIKGSFSLSGQRCTSIQLVCVEETAFDKFCDELIEQLGSFKPSQMPMNSQRAIKRLREIYEECLFSCAELLTPKIDWDRINDNTVSNIVFKGVTFENLLAKEEAFGPILGIISFQDVRAVIEKINDLGYGLQASIFSENLEKASELAHYLEVSRIHLNLAPSRSPDILPFPSSRKSGNSEQGIVNSLYFFSKYKGVLCKKVLEEKSEEDTSENSELKN